MEIKKDVLAGMKALVVETQNNKKEEIRAAKAKAAREALKGKLKTFKYLSVGGVVYQFPATEVNTEKFPQKLTALGQNPAEYKLLATKPRNSNPIEVIDLRIAVRRGNTVLVSQVKDSRMAIVENSESKTGYSQTATFNGNRLAWPHLSAISDAQFLNAVRESDLAIWYE